MYFQFNPCEENLIESSTCLNSSRSPRALSRWWTAKLQVSHQLPGHVPDVGGKSQTASCSSPWSATGTHAALNVPAARPSWGTLAPPATAKGAWFCVAVTTSSEKKEAEETVLPVLDCFSSRTAKQIGVFVCFQAVWGVQRLWSIHSSKRDGDEGTGECLPHQGKSLICISLCFLLHRRHV